MFVQAVCKLSSQYLDTVGYASCFVKRSVSSHSTATCILSPQANLRLDEPSRLPARATYLTLCHQYNTCTCCNASHDVTLRQQLYSILSDDNFAEDCRMHLTAAVCRYMDRRTAFTCPALDRASAEQCWQHCDEFSAYAANPAKLLDLGVHTAYLILLVQQMQWHQEIINLQIAASGTSCTAVGPLSANHADKLPDSQQIYSCTTCWDKQQRDIAGTALCSADRTMQSACLLPCCRVCDPEVGVGSKPHVCSSFCGRWFQACAGSYFEFDARTDQLRPCSSDAQRGICAQLSQIVADGNSLRQHSQMSVANRQNQPCFDGSAPVLMPSCQRQAEHHETAKEGRGAAAGLNANAILLVIAACAIVATLYHKHKVLKSVQTAWQQIRRRPAAKYGKFQGRARYAS